MFKLILQFKCGVFRSTRPNDDEIDSREREVEQLATTYVTVQELLYALQFVVFQVTPAIKKVVPFKLSNAKDLDNNCKVINVLLAVNYRVDPIFRPEAVLDPAQDVSWSDDNVDPRVYIMVKLAAEGLKFNNDMFSGGCPQKQKISAILKGVRGRKSAKQGRISKNPTGNRRIHQSFSNEEESV
ncbi:unnamed protein product [Arabidopsis thaliana]|uniref:(thale cress) hypothetical protein n=1 Tax=Arabidopsis thaliana TaxID=3702 RepID=A0A7G2DY38_ARATH|nr:unnamed protein product [Arabidopsis thaliana]